MRRLGPDGHRLGPDGRPAGLTLTNWDLGGEPSAWAYLHAGELFPAAEISPRRRTAELDRASVASVASVAEFAVQPGVSLDEYVARGPASGIVVVLGGRIVFERYLARFGMLFTPSSRVVADTPVISGADLRRIRPRRDLHRDPGGNAPGYAVAAYGGALPPPGRQWDFVTDQGDLFKGGFGGQGLYVSPGRDLVVAFGGTPAEDGSVNLLRWFSRNLALSPGA